MKVYDNKCITDVPYFKASGIHVGLRRKGRKDMCVIYSEKKAIAAAVFTTNKVIAAPLVLNKKNIKNENTQAIVINSGYANACNGKKGLDDAKAMGVKAAMCLGLKPEEVLIASTGRIGVALPMDIIIPGIQKACSKISYDGANDAAEAILTTDTFTKKQFVEVMIGGKKVCLGAIGKGSGMVNPMMGTILGFIVTNVNITKELLTKAMRDSTVDTFNMISVDGDTSTNDMAVIMSNKTAGNEIITEENDDYFKFKQALDFLNTQLSKLIAKDGEGATKLIEINVNNAATKNDARVCAKSVISSSLVKTAMFGEDANWGRIMCSLGYSGAQFDPANVDITFKNDSKIINIVQNGIGVVFNKEDVKEMLSQEYVNIIINLNDGDFCTTAWGCDLTYDYVKMNGNYRA